MSFTNGVRGPGKKDVIRDNVFLTDVALRQVQGAM